VGEEEEQQIRKYIEAKKREIKTAERPKEKKQKRKRGRKES